MAYHEDDDLAPAARFRQAVVRKWGEIEAAEITCRDTIRDLHACNLNEYAAQSRNDNDKWWHDPLTGEPLVDRNKGELIALMHSELSECLEGVRKGLMDDKLPHRTMEEVELVDCLIRIFDYAGNWGLDLEGAYQEKRAYNMKRADHSHEARKAQGGKAF